MHASFVWLLYSAATPHLTCYVCLALRVLLLLFSLPTTFLAALPALSPSLYTGKQQHRLVLAGSTGGLHFSPTFPAAMPCMPYTSNTCSMPPYLCHVTLLLPRLRAFLRHYGQGQHEKAEEKAHMGVYALCSRQHLHVFGASLLCVLYMLCVMQAVQLLLHAMLAATWRLMALWRETCLSLPSAS